MVGLYETGHSGDQGLIEGLRLWVIVQTVSILPNRWPARSVIRRGFRDFLGVLGTTCTSVALLRSLGVYKLRTDEPTHSMHSRVILN